MEKQIHDLHRLTPTCLASGHGPPCAELHWEWDIWVPCDQTTKRHPPPTPSRGRAPHLTAVLPAGVLAQQWRRGGGGALPCLQCLPDWRSSGDPLPQPICSFPLSLACSWKPSVRGPHRTPQVAQSTGPLSCLSLEGDRGIGEGHALNPSPFESCPLSSPHPTRAICSIRTSSPRSAQGKCLAQSTSKRQLPPQWMGPKCGGHETRPRGQCPRARASFPSQSSEPQFLVCTMGSVTSWCPVLSYPSHPCARRIQWPWK